MRYMNMKNAIAVVKGQEMVDRAKKEIDQFMQFVTRFVQQEKSCHMDYWALPDGKRTSVFVVPELGRHYTLGIDFNGELCLMRGIAELYAANTPYVKASELAADEAVQIHARLSEEVEKLMRVHEILGRFRKFSAALIECANQSIAKITITLSGDGFKAEIAGHSSKWEWARTRGDAVRQLLISRGDELGVVIEDQTVKTDQE